jgi:hypothetical protein
MPSIGKGLMFSRLQTALPDDELRDDPEPADHLQRGGDQEVATSRLEEHPDPRADERRDTADVDLLLGVRLQVEQRRRGGLLCVHPSTIPHPSRRSAP